MSRTPAARLARLKVTYPECTIRRLPDDAGFKVSVHLDRNTTKHCLPVATLDELEELLREVNGRCGQGIR